MGQAIMLGTLFGLIAVVYGVVLRFDPEARRARGGVDVVDGADEGDR